ncbi:MBL fold metallo-hydrolase [Streptomyces sp. NPDC004237]|uniref:MBL fold metallo-hydrolase n=1 Tax=Streptomyces sp. NPDC004237 TaxID=3154455 RepID=UPI0033A8EEC5
MADTTSTLSERYRRPSGIRTLSLGDTKLTYVPDGGGVVNARLWLPGSTDEDWARYPEHLDESGHLASGFGGLLVERDGRALLIDAGMGPLEAAPSNPFGTVVSSGALFDSLAALGRSPADIEAVALTHLHHDHVGWAWHPAPGSDRPAFTGADYLVTEPEWAQRHHAAEHGMGDIIKALEPQVRTVVDGEEIFPGVRVMLTPGHTAGHAAYVISAGGQRVIAFGDAFHAPVQIAEPQWEVVADHAPEQSVSLRQSLVDELAEPDTIGFGIHFADVPFGRVRIEGGRPVWHPVDA